MPSRRPASPAASASLFLVLLLVGDLVYIAIHLVWTETTLLNSPLAALDVDRGYAEFFQYMKLLWTGLLLTCLCLRTRRWGYLAWALLFAYLLVDDSFSLHENLGKMLADRLALQDAHRPARDRLRRVAGVGHGRRGAGRESHRLGLAPRGWRDSGGRLATCWCCCWRSCSSA